jgi:predicted ATPase with chaperone activity
MDLIRLSDTKLAALRDEIASEIRRRAEAAACGHDPAAVIHGNESAKRALVVAAAGGHSILFVGPPKCGKTMLRAAALELGLSDTFEARPCRCGWRCHPARGCECTLRQIERHLGRLPATDITVEMHPLHESDRARPGTTLTEMKRQIARMKHHHRLDLDEAAILILRAAVRETGLNEAVRLRIVQVARTIADLDRSEPITASHTAEAVNYRAFRP